MKKIFLVSFVLILTLINLFSDDSTHKTYIGVYLSDISRFSLDEGRFNADIILWCKWFGNEETPPIRFVNGEIDTMDEISKEKDGAWNSVKWHIQGVFRGTFPLQKFPFDKQQLVIQIDIPREYGDLVPDLAGSGMAEKFSITGWNYEPYFKSEVKSLVYNSDFGSIGNEGKTTKTNSVSFLLDLKRPLVPNLIKFLFPLIIVLLMSFVSFFISPEELEANLGLVVTALLTCVALHFALSDSIPDVPYLVTVDKFFIVAYIIILAIIVETVWVYQVAKDDLDKAWKIENISWKAFGISLFVIYMFFITTDLIIQPAEPKEKVVKRETILSGKDELVFVMKQLVSINSSNILTGLLTRGLYHEVTGNQKVPFLLKKVPDLTNECVRYINDGTVIVTWEIKDKLKWGDGTPITIDDLIFSLELINDENRIAINKVNKNKIEVSYKKRIMEIINEFRVLPKNRFINIIQRVDEGKLDEITEVSKELIDKLKKEQDKFTIKDEIINDILKNNTPPLDGPYILKEFVKDKYAILEVNPFFNGEKPLIKTIKVLVTDKDSSEVVLSGEGDLVSNLSVATFEKLDGKEHIATRTDNSNLLYLLQPDITIEPYNDINFRMALIYGINREEVVKRLFKDRGEIANSYRPTFSKDYNKKLTNYSYDPKKAKEYLSKVKINAPIKFIISKGVSKSPEYPAFEQVVEDVKALGLKVEVEITEKSVATLYSSGKHGGIIYTNRESSMEDTKKFWNKNSIPKEVKDLSEKFNNTMFDERRMAISYQLQEMFSQNIHVIPLAFGVYRSGFNDKLQNWKPRDVDTNIWWNVEELYFK
ncbi:MAG TPA: ABC transporter substrate-binding protein [Spirochaetota bacterium]|nr:ABC transporter substrate-binding protein [Spirochaetota bacterium]